MSDRDRLLAERLRQASAVATPADRARMIEGLAFGNLQVEAPRLQRATISAAAKKLTPRQR